jgi:myosin-7
MLAKLHKTHGSHRNYLKPKSDINTSFGLNHFAGVVFYDTRGEFLTGHQFVLLDNREVLVRNSKRLSLQEINPQVTMYFKWLIKP